MLAQYTRADGPCRLASTNGNVLLIGKDWVKLHPDLYKMAKNTAGVSIKDISDDKTEEKEALLRKLASNAYNEFYDSVTTKTGKASLIALKDACGQAIPRHIADEELNKYKEDKGL